MAYEKSDNYAVTQGFTKEIIVDCAHGTVNFAALVKPETDLDSTFRAFNTDEQEWVTVNGWNCDIEDTN